MHLEGHLESEHVKIGERREMWVKEWHNKEPRAGNFRDRFIMEHGVFAGVLLEVGIEEVLNAIAKCTDFIQ